MKYQLQKKDELNWQIFVWQEGGQEISRGRYAGQLTQAKWCGLESYHYTLENAAKSLLEMATRDASEAQVALDTDTVLAAIAEAREATLAAVAAVTPEEFSKKSARGRKKGGE